MCRLRESLARFLTLVRSGHGFLLTQCNTRRTLERPRKECSVVIGSTTTTGGGALVARLAADDELREQLCREPAMVLAAYGIGGVDTTAPVELPAKDVLRGLLRGLMARQPYGWCGLE